MPNGLGIAENFLSGRLVDYSSLAGAPDLMLEGAFKKAQNFFKKNISKDFIYINKYYL